MSVAATDDAALLLSDPTENPDSLLEADSLSMREGGGGRREWRCWTLA